MTTDVERLVVAIEAQTRQFERQLNKLEGQVGRSMRRNTASVNRLDRSFKAAALSAEKFMIGFARGAGAAALAGLPVLAQSAVASVAELGDAADRAGASAESLQIFRRALEQNGASARDADDGFRRLTRRMGEFANSGAGPAKAAIEGLGLEVFDLDGNLRSSDEILRQIAARFGEIENPAVAAAYAAQLFGDDAGPRLVPLLMQGEDALRSFGDQLRSTGTLMSNEMVDDAQRMNDAFNRLTSDLWLWSQTRMVGAANIAIDFADTFSQAADVFTEKAAQIQTALFGVEGAARQNLSGMLAAIDARGFQTPDNFFDRSTFRMPAQDPVGEIVDPRRIEAFRELRGQLEATEQDARRIVEAFGLFEQAGTQAARATGGALRDAAGEPMDLLNDNIRIANDNLQRMTQGFTDLADSIVNDVSSALQDGKIEWHEWAQIALNALSRVLTMMGDVNGTGGGNFFTSLLSSVFGGRLGSSLLGRSYEGGGYTGSGLRSGGLDGRGGFAAVLHPNETVNDHNLSAMPSMSMGGGGASSINMAISVNGSVSRAEMQDVVGAAANQLRQEFPGIAVRSVAKHKKYGGQI
ncbi:MAG: phage tail tape measure protein [Pseudomonadota bacterium]